MSRWDLRGRLGRLVTGACFAELGHEIVVRDVVPAKIEVLQRGEVRFLEEGCRTPRVES